MSARRSISLLAGALWFASASARADELPRGGARSSGELAPSAAGSPPPTRNTALALVVGGGVLIGAFGFGSHVMADGGLENRGIAIVHAGFALAPMLSHLMVGEPERGLWFTLVPTGIGIANALLVESRPRVQLGGKAADRTVYELMIITSLATGVVGVLDVLGAEARVPFTELHVAPTAGSSGLGLRISGAL